MDVIKFKKENGKYEWESNPRLALDLLRNGNYEMIIKKRVSQRSTSQNALMWMWFTCMEEQTGQSKDDIHDYYCMKFLSRHICFNGKDKIVGGSTHSLNTDEMAVFLDKVQADAATELGIRLPNPDDRYFDDFKYRYGRRY